MRPLHNNLHSYQSDARFSEQDVERSDRRQSPIAIRPTSETGTAQILSIKLPIGVEGRLYSCSSEPDRSICR